MSDTPVIPYGYRQVVGQLQKGDGLFDGKRFRKVRKDYPFIGTREGIAIRLCEVETPVIPLAKEAFDAARTISGAWIEPVAATTDAGVEPVTGVIPETVAAHEEEWVEP